MTQAQKIIKYVALAFAFSLIFSIASFIMRGILVFTNVFDENASMENLEELRVNENASLLEIDVSSVNIIIKTGDSLKVETNNNYIEAIEDKNKLFIKEKRHSILSNHVGSLVVYVPENFTWDGVYLSSQAGTLKIDSLTTKILDLDVGAGEVQIQDLSVLDDTKIEGGAGKITIQNGNIHNLDLDMGIGQFELTSKLTGDNKVDAGVGKINLHLVGSSEDYKIKIDKGLGDAKINNEKIQDGTMYGSGSTTIDIDGGIGSIDVAFAR